MCILVGSEPGEGPALLTATIRNCNSSFSLRFGIFPVVMLPGTSAAGSQSCLNLQ